MNSDFEELLSLFTATGVRYLVVGGHAVMLYTEPRYTKGELQKTRPSVLPHGSPDSSCLTPGEPDHGVTEFVEGHRRSACLNEVRMAWKDPLLVSG